MTYVILILVGLVAGLLSGSVGFGGGMVLLPVITYFYGVEVAVPVSTIAQLVSNLSRVGMGWKQINWKAAGQFLLLAVPFTALGALGFAKFPKGPMTIVLCVFLAPVSYIASEATAASVMHIVKAIVYGKLNLMSGNILLSGLMIGAAMMLGNFIAMRCIRNVNRKRYQKIVAGVMIAVSLWLIVSNIH